MMKESNYDIAKARADAIEEHIIEVLQSGKSFRVEAGAGSGKTFSLHKVVEWIDAHKAKEYARRGQQVACITYTNAAVDVITSRIASDSSIIPSTIHNFVWENIRSFKSSLVVAVNELEMIPEDHDAEEVKGVVYDLGLRYVDENGILHLFHDDIIKLFVWFLDKKKFRMILSDRYPLILIDEYQDSSKRIIDKFLEFFVEKEIGPQFGFFGDAWQTIYSSNGACGLINSNKLVEIKKESNFRSQKVIVDVLNKIRPDLPQITACDENDGEVIVITTNDYTGVRVTKGYFKDELPSDVLSSYVNAVYERLEQSGWESNNKILMITHKLLARQQSYQSVLDVLGDHFRDQDDDHYVFFRDRLEPLFAALSNNDAKAIYDVLGMARHPIETKSQKKQWRELRTLLAAAREKTIYDVLRVAIDSRLIPIPPILEKYIKQYDADENPDYHKSKLKVFYDISYKEIIHAIDFFKDDGLYSTDHGVKGEEYDNVLLVMGRGWNLYKFEDILYKDESNLQGKELDAYIRNRNLFYVCCSRPKRRLALLITVPIDTHFKQYLELIFGSENIVPYTSFIK